MELLTSQGDRAACMNAGDLAIKALAACAATHWAAACAAARQDPAARVANAEQFAGLLAGPSADALTLATGGKS